MDGLTVRDILEMIKANQAFGDVLQAVNNWRKLPVDRKLSSSLYAGLNRRAKENGWGCNPDGQISKKQYEEIGDIFIQSSKKLAGKRGIRIYPTYEEATKEK